MLHVVDPTGAAAPAGVVGRVVVVTGAIVVAGAAVVGAAAGAASGGDVVVEVVVDVVVGTIEVAELCAGTASCWRTIAKIQLRNPHQSHEGPRAFAGMTVPETMTTTSNHATIGRPLPPGRCMGSRVGRTDLGSSLSVVFFSL